MKAANSKFVNKGLLVILSALVLATIASIIFLSHSLLKLNTLISYSGQSSRSVRLMQELLIHVDDAETGVRGYIITNNPQYLEPYNQGSKLVPATLAEIKQTPTSLISTKEYQTLSQLSNERLTQLQNGKNLKQNGDEAAINMAYAGGRGKQVMDTLRRTINTLSTRNVKLVGDRQQQAHNSVRRAIIVAVAVSVFLLAICLVIIRYFQRAILHERALENTKSEFLSLASHQLRTPATNVKQYVGLLLDGYLGKLTKKQRGALEVAYRNNELEIRIMNDLLDVAKLDMKRIQLHKKRVNLASLVKQVVKEYESTAVSKGQTLTVRGPEEALASVDRDYLKGVIEKLIDNAVKYSKNKTKITVKVKIDNTIGMFEIMVRDQGLGIQKREVPKLFMKFSRLANEFSANSEGSGMGLYWVKQIMTLHGGSVAVVSKEGSGSKFIIRGPIG